MKQTFFFYDLETSGLNPRTQRVMQFAGQRTDMELNPIGDPVDILVKLSEDILPDPQAILITGTTPQKTHEEGISEPEFARMLVTDIFTPGTIAVGFNNVRFDDEFVRHTLWRNFYDPYEWSWSEKRSRWDILDLVRITRALRPEGIEWPIDEAGAPVNKLELLSKVNNLEHTHAHDALSDVEATIHVARMIRDRQPKLFDYMLSLRTKSEVAKLVNLDAPQPLVYSSGKYGKKHQFTTVVLPIAQGARPGTALVYDLRYDPQLFADLSVDELKKRAFASREERQADGFQALPVKEVAYNKCPALAPVGVMSSSAWETIELSLDTVGNHMKKVDQSLVDKVVAALSEREAYPKQEDVESQLYDGFGNAKDASKCEVIRVADENELADFHPLFIDERLPELLVRYKARNFPRALSQDEQEQWATYRLKKFHQCSPRYMRELQALGRKTTNENHIFLLEELRLWWESTAPTE